MMLEEDEYKRDDFVTASIKIKQRDEYSKAYSDYKSDDKTNSKSSAQLKNKKMKKMMRARK